MFKNICLVGLPYSGKSLLDRHVALKKNIGFIETDLMIQYKYNSSLKNIISAYGTKKFLEIEENVGLNVHCENTIISTGGSMIYNKNALHHFKNNLNCKIIHLNLSLPEFRKRVDNLENRGVINPFGLNFIELYTERIRLCNVYADEVIDADIKENAIENLLKF